MQSKDAVNTRYMRLAAGITQYTVLQQTVSVFFSFGKWKEYILKEG